MSRLKKTAAAGAVAATLVGGFEGWRTNAYPDPGTHGKPWTICAGATKVDGVDVKPGDYIPIPRCKEILIQQLDVYADKVEACTSKPALEAMPDRRFVAFVSFAYNLGPARYCNDIAPLVNRGLNQEACDKMLRYNRAAGVVMKGLVTRREREHSYCVVGL